MVVEVGVWILLVEATVVLDPRTVEIEVCALLKEPTIVLVPCVDDLNV